MTSVDESDVSKTTPQTIGVKLDVAPFADGGIGSVLSKAAEDYQAEYVYSPDEGADHEPTEFEGWLIEDFWNGLLSDERFFGPIRELLALAALSSQTQVAGRGPGMPTNTSPSKPEGEAGVGEDAALAAWARKRNCDTPEQLDAFAEKWRDRCEALSQSYRRLREALEKALRYLIAEDKPVRARAFDARIVIENALTEER